MLIATTTEIVPFPRLTPTYEEAAAAAGEAKGQGGNTAAGRNYEHSETSSITTSDLKWKAAEMETEWRKNSPSLSNQSPDETEVKKGGKLFFYYYFVRVVNFNELFPFSFR